jgi:hypothetical protein
MSYSHEFMDSWNRDYRKKWSTKIYQPVRDRIKDIVRAVKENPIPPTENDEWKELEDFSEGDIIVSSVKITHWDRAVYEFNKETQIIFFTDCQAHKYTSSTTNKTRYYSSICW